MAYPVVASLFIANAVLSPILSIVHLSIASCCLIATVPVWGALLVLPCDLRLQLAYKSCGG